MEDQNKTTFNEIKNEAQNFFKSVYFKIGLVILLILFLMIPKFMISDIIKERKLLREEAVREVSHKWGTAQVIKPGVLTIPYTYREEVISTTDTTYKVHQQTLKVLPTTLKIDGTVIPKEKYRGIYKIPLYQSQMQIECTFDPINDSQLDLEKNEMDWTNAVFALGIKDLAGINENITLNHRGSQYKMKPIDQSFRPFANGLQTTLPLKGNQQQKLTFNLNINGSETIQFAPLGQETKVTLRSDWKDPSFLGNFLPDSKTITNDGFEATWKIQEVNRSIPQHWIDKDVNLDNSNFGVSLFVSVDHYQKSMRSIKYALLTIVLTFSFFIFIELLKFSRVHIFQFALVGLSLVLFYSLLVSLSEHMNFNLSYWISGGCTILLNLIYTIPTLKSWKLTTIFGITLTGLYAFVFFLLQLESYALLAGNIGLFIILAIVMLASRKVKWAAK